MGRGPLRLRGSGGGGGVISYSSSQLMVDVNTFIYKMLSQQHLGQWLAESLEIRGQSSWNVKLTTADGSRSLNEQVRGVISTHAQQAGSGLWYNQVKSGWSRAKPMSAFEAFLRWFGKESACNAGDLGSIPVLGRSPGEGNGYLFLLGETYGQRSLAGYYRPWDHNE